MSGASGSGVGVAGAGVGVGLGEAVGAGDGVGCGSPPMVPAVVTRASVAMMPRAITPSAMTTQR